jgi:ABC-type transport system involved in cytochrome c biogenesis permease subunit
MGETRLWYSLFLLVAGVATYARWRFRWILSFSALLSTVFMVINILRPELHDKGLMPALQSAWFMPHVAVYMFSYALLGVATLMAVYHLVKHDERVVSAIENLLGGGVALFTVGMLTGALWAKQAWGQYWNWDPKETWAAITWISYLAYIHLRIYGKGSVKLLSAVLIFSFLCLQMCWWGINYLPTAQDSIHVYNR